MKKNTDAIKSTAKSPRPEKGKPVRRFLVTTVLALGTLVLGASVVSAATAGPSDHPTSAIDRVPIADANGDPLRDADGNYLVLNVTAEQTNFDRQMKGLTNALERANRNPQAQARLEAKVEELFGHDPDLVEAMLETGADEGEPQATVVEVDPIAGDAWMDSPDEGPLDSRHFVEAVSPKEFKEIERNIERNLKKPGK